MRRLHRGGKLSLMGTVISPLCTLLRTASPVLLLFSSPTLDSVALCKVPRGSLLGELLLSSVPPPNEARGLCTPLSKTRTSLYLPSLCPPRLVGCPSTLATRQSVSRAHPIALQVSPASTPLTPVWASVQPTFCTPSILLKPSQMGCHIRTPMS